MSHDAPAAVEKKEATVKNDLLSGLTVALALVPEAIAFAFAAGITNPLVGLYAAFIMAICTSVIGGRPGMISGATGAIALVCADLIHVHGQELGLQYLFAAVVVMGILQIIFGVFRFGKFIRLVPHPVMLGFVNGLAIIIGLAQFESFKIPTLDEAGNMMYTEKGHIVKEWMAGSQLFWMIGLVAFTMFVIYIFPKITKKFPSALAGILACTAVVLLGNHFGFFAEGFVSTVPAFASDMPTFAIPGEGVTVTLADGSAVNFFSMHTLKIIFPFAAVMAAVGLIESLMTLSLIDEMTDTRGRGNRECVGQGVANIVTGFFGGMGGCAMIGQSVININSGGRGRLSGLSAGLFLLCIIMFFSNLIAMVPMAALTGVMFMVVVGTFAWSSLRILHKVPFSDAFVIVLVSAVTVITDDLAKAVLAGVIVSALAFAWKKSQVITARSPEDEDGIKTYVLNGSLFFGSITNFNELFTPLKDPQEVHIDFLNCRVYDHSAIEAISKLAKKYKAQGKEIHLKHLSRDCVKLIKKAGHVVDVNMLEDPKYRVADDSLA